jgi:uncharacterized membrane protein
VKHGRLEAMLAALLRHGSWLASAVIGIGLVLAFTGAETGMRTATVGIAMFILLPMLRVLLMLVFYIRERNLRFACIAGLVLAIILLGMIPRFPAK